MKNGNDNIFLIPPSVKVAGPTSPFEDIGELVSTPTPAVPWIAENLLAEQDITLISGKGGIGKSYVLMQLAIDLAAGRPVLGRFPAVRPHRVLYLDLEMPRIQTRRRFQRMLAGAGVAPDNLVIARDARRCLPGVWLDHEKPQLEPLKTLLKVAKPELVLVDSLRRLAAGDLNNSMGSNYIFGHLDTLRSEFGCGFGMISHQRKLNQNTELNDPGEMLIGSVDLRNMADCHIAIYSGDTDQLIIQPDKNRQSDQRTTNFMLRFVHEDRDLEDGPFQILYEGSPEATGLEQKVVLALSDKGGQNRADLAKKIGKSVQTVRLVTETLIAKGLIVKSESKGGVAVVYDLTPKT